MNEPSSSGAGFDRMFLDNLGLVDRVVATIARKYRLDPADADDFGSWAKAKLIERDYRVLRQFAGRSSLSTYLVVVLTNLFHDYQNNRWGRWRPSAAARRLGPVAVRLETLIVRDRYPVAEAIEVIRSAGASHLTGSDLARLAAKLPPRTVSREVDVAAAESELVGPLADAGAGETETEEVTAAVRDIIGDLPAEDQLIVRMRFWDDLSVADIARALGTEQKPLYRRLERIQALLASSLLGRGIDRERIGSMLHRQEVA